MTDIKKVIKGIELCNAKNCDACPYKIEQDETYAGLCQHIMQNDALKLLKEQKRLIEEAFEKGFKDGQNNMLEAEAENSWRPRT